MSPPRTLTGDTFMDEKTPRTPVSPTDTENTLMGDAALESLDDDRVAPQLSSGSSSSVDVESAQPRK